MVKFVQPLNAPAPILVTLSGIVTLVRVVLFWNAAAATPVIARLLMVAGMTTAPPGPVYPVMISPPLPSAVVANCTGLVVPKLTAGYESAVSGSQVGEVKPVVPS